MQRELLNGFQLRDYQVDPLRRTVRSARGSTHLGSKSVEVLLKLAERPHTLVSREELLDRVWGNPNASSESLNSAISELRHALADDHHSPVFIQTVPRRGYRLLVEPEFGAPTSAGTETSEPFFANLLRRGVIQAGAAFLVVGWAILQVIDVVGPNLGLPEWTRPFATYAVIGGLPVVLVLAWFFEYAEGRLYIDRGRTAPGFMAGLQKNYVSIIVAYVIAFGGATVYQAAVGFPVPGGQVADAETPEALIPIEPNSIAVLRFMNIDGSEQTEVFSQGLAEDVLDRLARIPGLLVSARGDSWSLPVNASSEAVRKRLRVAYYLEGSVRIVGDDLRVVAQLIDSEKGIHVVSRSFDRELEDFVEVQRDLTDLTVASLRIALPKGSDFDLAGSYAGTDVDAYLLYRRGMEVIEAPDTTSLLERAKDYFHQALELDPGYAAAHAGLCLADVRRYELSTDPADITAAELACASAIETNPRLPMVHSALGNLYLSTGRIENAASAFSAALKVDPKNAAAIRGLASVASAQQDVPEADRLFRRSIELQPGSWSAINAYGNFLFGIGRYGDAAAQYRRVVLLDPENWVAHGNLGSALMMVGDFDSARIALERSLAIELNQSFFSNLGIIHYYLGDFEKSSEIHRQVAEIAPNSQFVWLNLADATHFSGGGDAPAAAAYTRAAELSRASLGVNPADADSLYVLAWSESMLGNTNEARRHMDRALELSPNNPYLHYYDALLHVRRGNVDDAIDAIEKAVDMGYPVSMLMAEPFMEAIRDEPRFTSLVARR